jgi:hypothetical protein
MLFCGVLSIRFHPRDDGVVCAGDFTVVKCQFASEVADCALVEFRRRFPCRGSVP